MYSISVNKIDVAKRQVEASIRLHFSGEDPIVVHTIASAAHQILRDISGHRETSEWHKDLTQLIRPDMKKEFWANINKSYNFLKHADKDPDETLELEENINDHTIISCCGYFITLGYAASSEMLGFVRWYEIMYPQILDGNSRSGSIISTIEFDNSAQYTREDKLNYGWQLIHLIKNINIPTS
jgi:hypothetical protein